MGLLLFFVESYQEIDLFHKLARQTETIITDGFVTVCHK